MTETTILITGAGGSGTPELIRTLREIGTYRVIACDASSYSWGFTLADASYTIPFAMDKQFLTVMRQIIDKEQPDFIVPLVDEEILLFHDIAKDYDGLKVLAPQQVFCETALDKWMTYQRLSQANISVPYSCLADQPQAVKYPAVIKPRQGRGSRGVAYLQNRQDLDYYVANAKRSPDQYIVQQQIMGVEFTTSVVVGLDNTLLTIVPKEVVVKRGITQVGVTRENAAIDRLCRQIHEQLQPEGPFNMQSITDEVGQPYVIEINPRYSTTIALTIAAGVHEVDILVKSWQQKPVGTLSFQPDLLMVRHFAHYYGSEQEWTKVKNNCK